MDYDALTIDTQTVEANSFNFDGGLLGQLKQFANGRVEVVISLVVATEIGAHLREKMQSAKDALETAYKKAHLYGLKSAEDKAFGESPDVPTLSRNRLTQYLRDIGATVVSPNDVPVRDLLRAYFLPAPPFAGAGKKKSEFPDAIALMSLELWAKANKKRILAVSGDPDWAAFAEKSEHIDVVEQLSDALTKLQEDTDEAEAVVEALLSDIQSRAKPDLAEQLESKLSAQISGTYVYPEADSSFAIEGDDGEATLNHYDFDEVNGDFQSRVVQVGRAIIVASVPLRVNVNATASFSLSAYDSVDKEYLSLGTTTARKEDEDLDVTVLITFEGNFDGNDVKITKVELEDELSIHFGEVEPDYGDPDYDDLYESEAEPDEHFDPSEPEELLEPAEPEELVEPDEPEEDD